MAMRKPLWKIVNRGGMKYAEMLLRCNPYQHQDAREALEQYGSIKEATAAILERFATQADTSDGILAEMQRQHEAHLSALKASIKDALEQYLSTLVANGGEVIRTTPDNPESIVDDVWAKLEQ